MDIFRNARQNFLRRQAEVEQADLERQEAREVSSRSPEMRERSSQGQQDQDQQERPQTRSSPVSAMLRRFADLPRPSIPSFVSRQSGNRPRPTSSRYTDSNDDEVISPKTPQFTLGMTPMPSTRLHLPNLRRTWTEGSNGPPSRPGTARSQFQAPIDNAEANDRGGRPRSRARQMAEITEPVPSVPAQHIYNRNLDSTEDAGNSSESHGSSRRGRRRRFDGVDPAEMHLASMAEDGRRRRHRRHENDRRRAGHRSGRHRQYATGEGQQSTTATTTTDAASKRFLFCFPYVRSRRMRALILRCFVSGSFLALMSGVFLALFMTHNIYNSEFAVLLILILVFTTLFFAHSLIRLCIMVVRPPSPAEEEAAENRYRRRRAGPFGILPDVYGPGGYAIPQEPIRVVLARDEEAAGMESMTAKIQPPAYGLWRESVRVDPNRIYWQRNDDGAASTTHETPGGRSSNNSSSNSRSSSSRRSANTRSSNAGGEATSDTHDGHSSSTGGRQSPRPPSYVSDDGVQYVVEAQPRSIAPTNEIPLPQHPAEAGRTGRAAAW